MEKTSGLTQGKNPEAERACLSGIFRCHWDWGAGDIDHWNGRWSLVGYRSGKLIVEMKVEGRSGTSTVLFGEYRDGEHYICVPDLDVGCPLSFDVQDTYWNAERLGKHMNKIDAATIAYAVADFARRTGWKRHGHPCPQDELMDRLDSSYRALQKG